MVSGWWNGRVRNILSNFKGRRGPTLPLLQPSGLVPVFFNTPQLPVLALSPIGMIGAPLQNGFGMKTKEKERRKKKKHWCCPFPAGNGHLQTTRRCKQHTYGDCSSSSRSHTPELQAASATRKKRSVRKALFTMSRLWSGSCLSRYVHMAWHCNSYRSSEFGGWFDTPSISFGCCEVFR